MIPLKNALISATYWLEKSKEQTLYFTVPLDTAADFAKEGEALTNAEEVIQNAFAQLIGSDAIEVLCEVEFREVGLVAAIGERVCGYEFDVVADADHTECRFMVINGYIISGLDSVKMFKVMRMLIG